jgi:ribosome recycling factor
MSEEYLEGMADDFNGVVSRFEKNLVSIRTGRASPQMLENVSVLVASYGTNMPLNQLASISAPDARLLVLNPWDKSTISDIEKGILTAGMGLNPQNDGQLIRVPIPPLTAERRRDLEKKVNAFAEDARIAARKVRKDYNDIFKDLEKDKEISEDDLKRFMGTIQDATNECVSQVDNIAKAKCQEVREG